MPLRATDVPSADADRRNWRRSYLFSNAFELGIAFAAVVSAVVYLADPLVRREASVGHIAQGLAPAWTVLYAFGGLLVSWGLLRPAPRIEIAGLSSFAAALVIQGLAIVLYQGLHGVSAGATFIALTVACGARGYIAWHIAHAAARLDGAL